MAKKPKKKHARARVHIGDITTEIARAKAASRVHGPFMVTCTACGERYWPDHKEAHLRRCTPPEVHIYQPPRGTPCPYCGKIKAGPLDHIRAKHPDKAAEAFLQSPANPQLSTVSQTTQPSTPPLSTFSHKQPSLSRPAPQLRRVHGLLRLECPHCFARVVSKKPGRQRCPECDKTWSTTPLGAPAGLRPECPHCLGDFYSERVGFLTCPVCGHRTVYDASGNPIPPAS